MPFLCKKCWCANNKQEEFLAGAGAGAEAGAAEAERYYIGQVANTSCEIWVLFVYYVCVLLYNIKEYNQPKNGFCLMLQKTKVVFNQIYTQV